MSGQRLSRQSPPVSVAETGTVARALRLIECFAEVQEWPLNALAQRLGLPPSTTHRLLKLCSAQGFVASDGKGVYRPGLALYRLAGVLSHRFPVRQIALPLLERFTAEFAETALLTLIDRPALQMFFAAKSEPKAPMRYVIETDRLGPLSWGATGRSLLAHLTEPEIAAVLRRAEPSPANGAAFDPAALRAELAEIRRAGFAFSRGQRSPEGVAFAVPFFDAAGAVAGNVAVTVPGFRYTEANGRRFLAALRGMAVEMTRALGGSAAAPEPPGAPRSGRR
jgi:IclR family transcriptional regulator, KDG regulon repressor